MDTYLHMYVCNDTHLIWCNLLEYTRRWSTTVEPLLKDTPNKGIDS